MNENIVAKLKDMFKRKTKGDMEDLLDEIQVHPHTKDPTFVWIKLQRNQEVRKIKTIPPETPIREDSVRFVCVSDTHNKTNRLRVPPGDVLLHAGDFTMTGQMGEVEHFNTWLGTLPHKHKIVIAGNHDISFDDNMLAEYETRFRFRVDAEEVNRYLKRKNVNKTKDLLTNCTYLEDSGVQLYGISIYGSPWQPEFCGWAFNLERGQPCLDKWNLIPDDTDILMTHGPPVGHGDMCSSNMRAGCVELLHTIQKRVKPKYHIFGHIHEGYGITTDGTTKYINASTCSLNYKPTQRPIVFDFKLPAGVSKTNCDIVPVTARNHTCDGQVNASPKEVRQSQEVDATCSHCDSSTANGQDLNAACAPEEVSDQGESEHLKTLQSLTVGD